MTRRMAGRGCRCHWPAAPEFNKLTLNHRQRHTSAGRERGKCRRNSFNLPGGFWFLRCGQGQGDENFWLFVFIRRCACEAPVLTEWPPHRGVKSGQTSGRGLREARISAGCSCLEWAGYLKWPDCPLFMTSCPTAQIVFATFTHLKGQRRKDVVQTTDYAFPDWIRIFSIAECNTCVDVAE